MNFTVLEPKVQDYIRKNENANTTQLILKGSPFAGITPAEIAQQIEARKKAKRKLPTWYAAKQIYFPPGLNLEQTSSEITAKYKASLVKGKKLIDLTGGFGIDSFSFAEVIEQVIHVEQNKELSQIAQHNFKQLSTQDNTTFICGDSIAHLANSTQHYDTIFIDPARRDELGGKVFRLQDCEPDVLSNLNLLTEKSDLVLIKTAPLLDIQLGLKELGSVKEIHIVAVNNEVKELLWLIDKNSSFQVKLICKNFAKDNTETFEAFIEEENQAKAEYAQPLQFLYEPNATLLKAGFFQLLAEKFQVKKIAQHSHLYTSEELISFPGRRFKVIGSIPFSKKTMKSWSNKKANITTRNFPISVETIRKKYKIKDGGVDYLFFTTTQDGEKIAFHTQKV
ncbi:class I SAM-dependent methyltransferase [Mesonia ostreae]|uniref:RsmD family RNA methyltransferase n=1 Tax=Mesonia ostreae TaxID=861110 RepID=A0ABU2KI76_9FLAO|nr:RsmD family RNA methyltransferase [Mesonia ostreae]MDT0294368.1 RsmD family RNA methyltransferase [Mesonia ostreae]